MKRLFFSLLFCAATLLVAQNYTAYNAVPVARLSFLRSQWTAANNFRDSSLLLYLPMTGQQGLGPFFDESGHGSVATLTGIYAGPYAGKLGPYAPYFNKNRAPNNVFNVSSPPAIPGTFTVSAWAHPNALSSNFVRVVESFYQTGFYLGTDFSGSHFLFMVNEGTGSLVTTCIGGTVTSGAAWPNNAWHMVTGVYDGANGYLYVDGVLVSPSGGVAFTNPGSTSLNIGIGYCSTSGLSGCSANSPLDAWDGQIQGVRIYGRALSQAEIQAIYTAENH